MCLFKYDSVLFTELTGVLLADGVVPADDENGNKEGWSIGNGIFLLNQAPDFFKNLKKKNFFSKIILVLYI